VPGRAHARVTVGSGAGERRARILTSGGRTRPQATTTAAIRQVHPPINRTYPTRKVSICQTATRHIQPPCRICTYAIDPLRNGSGVQNAVSVGVAGDADLGQPDGSASGSRPFLSARRDERPRATPVPGVRQKALLCRAAEVTFFNPARIHPGPAAFTGPGRPVAGAASAGPVRAGCEHRADAAGIPVMR